MLRSFVTGLVGILLGFAPPATDPAGPAPTSTPAPRATKSVAFETYPEDPIGVRKFVLPNGLTVLLSENHERPSVFGAVVIDAGSKNDPQDATGMAHYLEHMLFKGTRELGTTDYAAEKPHLDEIEGLFDTLVEETDPAARSRIREQIDAQAQLAGQYAIPQELDRLLGELGSKGVNAYTTPDITVYHNELPASQLSAWLAIQGHRFEHPVFRLFPSELEAVYEEKNSAQDGFYEPLADVFLKKFFPGHPYGAQTTLGSIEHLKRPSLSKMRAFFDTWYVANNMALVLVGDFDSEQVIADIEQYFGSLPKRPLPDIPIFTPPKTEGRTLETVRMTPIRAAGIAWRTVPPSHPDYPALQVIEGLLTNNQGSGSLDRLARDGKLLYATTLPFDFHDSGLSMVIFIPRLIFQSFNRAEQLVRDQFTRIARGDIAQAELDAVRTNLLTSRALEWEDNETRALALAETFAQGQSWGQYLEHWRSLETMSPADIAKVATRYFGDRRFVMRSRMGKHKPAKLEKPGYTPIKATRGRHSAFYEQVKQIPSTPFEPRLVDLDADVARHHLREGVNLEWTRNPFDDGIYTLDLRFGVGRYHLRELFVLDEYLSRIGAGSRSAQQFKAALFQIATTVDFFAMEDQFIVRVQGPEEHLPRALDLLGEIMDAPDEDRKALRRIRLERQANRRVERGDPASVADALADFVVYGDDSPYLRDYGPASLCRLRVRDLLSAWKKVQGREVEIGYVGGLPAAELSELVAALPLARVPKPAQKPVSLQRRVVSKDITFLVKRRKAVQTHLWHWVPGKPIALSERPRAHAFNEYVAGESSGLFFQEIRELRALAYAAYGYYDMPDLPHEPGHLLAYVACQADKTEESAEVLGDLIERLPQRPEMMEAMRASLFHAAQSQQPTARTLQYSVETWERLGYTEDPRKTLLPAYGRLEFDRDVVGFWREQVADRPQVRAVLGDPSRFDLDEVVGDSELILVPERKLFAR